MGGIITLHVLLSFIYNKAITSVGFLGIFVLSVCHDSDLRLCVSNSKDRDQDNERCSVTLSIGPNRENSRSKSASFTS